MFRAILRNINLLNVLLFSTAIIFAFHILFPIFNVKLKYTLPNAKKDTKAQEEKIVKEFQIPSIEEYVKIADENLFHPERKIPVEKPVEQPLPKPEFVLYGTLITDDLQLAYIEDLKAPFTTPGRGKRQASLRKGDKLSGFTLKEIEAEKIVMVRGEESIVVRLNDPLRPKSRETVQITTVASTPQVQTSTPVTAPSQVQTAPSKKESPLSVQQQRQIKNPEAEQRVRPDIKNLKIPEVKRPSGNRRGGALLFGNQP